MVYLDYNATTPVDPRVLEAMMPALSGEFGNPSSTHAAGQRAAAMVERAREQVASAVGMASSDVVFASGATEANNLALAGLGLGWDRNYTVLYGAAEHKSVIETCTRMEEWGPNCRPIPVTPDGVVDPCTVREMMGVVPDTALVSVAAANSETGAINPVDEIAKVVHDAGALLHCDATQAIGKIPFDAGSSNIDIVTISSHKIYGPKGCGALVAGRDTRRMIKTVMHGGGQERGLRSGTLNVPGIVGFGRACELAADEGLADAPQQRSIRDEFEEKIAAVGDVTVNGKAARRLPNTSNIRIAGALADAVIVNARGIDISSGSACSSSAMEPSHVLTAMGLSRDAADESIRVSFGRPSKAEDAETAATAIADAARFVRAKESESAMVTNSGSVS